MLLTLSSCGGGSGSQSRPPSDACATLPPATAPSFQPRLQRFLDNLCYQKLNWQHDANVRTSDGVHTFVKVWYSPSLMTWINNNRVGAPPDGSIIVKEERPKIDAPLAFWNLMIKDSNLSWDGWYWAALTPKSKQSSAASDAGGGCAEPQSLLGGAGLYCLNCHASAINNQGTFASTAYMGPMASHGLGAPGMLDGHMTQVLDAQASAPQPGFTGRVPSSVFADVKPLAAASSFPCMVSEALDHAVAAGPAQGGPDQFITSDQCSGCHDATGTLAGLTPNMIYGTGGSSPQNLSPYGEWRYSMMGLAGRDPIFFAQLDTESTLHARLAGKRNGAAFVQDLCLRCHGVMGQRQYHLDKGNDPDTLFTRDQLQSPSSKYAALARDGVSCAVCHHMSNEDLQDPSTYAGLFKVGPATEFYGPYPSDPNSTGPKNGHDVIPRPMQNAIGITPTEGTQIQQANLCASCHTIPLPVYDAKGNPVMEDGQPKIEYEQTTFFEWLNSGFITVPCQQCHMPTDYQGNALAFEIANIEDNTFPQVPETGPSTRLPDADLMLETRSPYGRHQLLGVNVFALDMFDQFRTNLGLFKVDPNLPSPLQPVISSQKTAVAGAVAQAQVSTAQVTIPSVTVNGGTLQADVEVNNLAGHNFPSGVSFRRAFIDFQVLDSKGNVLWESGNTNADGVIVDDTGTPLVTEFFDTQQTFQPHFWTGNPITSDKQVEIYEELAVNPEGSLTTSFLSLDHKVKDNRIQPQGRSFNGPNADITAPVGTGADTSYTHGCGCSLVRYQLPLTGPLSGATAVNATLYYQSIPPYYLRQRGQEGHGPDTARLVSFVNDLDLTRYPEIANWKLLIAGSGPVSIP